MNDLRLMRLFGDTIFATGALILGGFVLGLLTGHSYTNEGYVAAGQAEVR